jgi:glutathione S-transferase
VGEVPVLEHRGPRFHAVGVILDYLAEATAQFVPANGDEPAKCCAGSCSTTTS